MIIVVLKIIVAASVVNQLMQHLNAWKDGKYVSNVNWTPVNDVGITAQQNCTECHVTKIPTPPSVKK